MLAGHEEYSQAVLKVKSNMDSGMFRPLQLAAAEALSAPAAWYEEINRIYRERQVVAAEIMDLLGCTVRPNQAGMFLWGSIPEKYANSVELSDRLLYQANVFVTPGIIFGKNGQNHIRISLCSSQDLLLNAKKRIIKHLNNPA
jgi:hypothetical protein